ncbi:MAG: FKBP-type peptidyl-prolyl cis-trans isomerase [Prevotella sp.]|nr:FKBP-type peptidyl-prolyl cis-trans isomerase [Prevotella sp.]
MKKILIAALVLVASASFSPADAGKKKPVPVPAEEPLQLIGSSDSVSYAAGMRLTEGLIPFLLQQKVDTTLMDDFLRGFREVVKSGDNPQQRAYMIGMDIARQLNERMVPGMTKEFQDSPDSIIAEKLYKGFEAALKGDTSVFTTDAATKFFTEKQQADKAAKEEKLYGAVRDAGMQFLMENAKQEGVIKLPSGLQYKVLVKGDGEVPQADDKVLVNYEGRLIDGTVFDASSKHGDTPAEFTPAQVIKGWTEALTMMPVGSKWQLYIPYYLAYGERGAGADIKPYSTLIFDVELVGINRK